MTIDLNSILLKVSPDPADIEFGPVELSRGLSTEICGGGILVRTIFSPNLLSQCRHVLCKTRYALPTFPANLSNIC